MPRSYNSSSLRNDKRIEEEEEEGEERGYEFARGNRIRVVDVSQLQPLNMQFHPAGSRSERLEVRKFDFVMSPSRKPQARRDSPGNPWLTSFFSRDNPAIPSEPLKTERLNVRLVSERQIFPNFFLFS